MNKVNSKRLKPDLKYHRPIGSKKHRYINSPLKCATKLSMDKELKKVYKIHCTRISKCHLNLAIKCMIKVYIPRFIGIRWYHNTV